MPTDKQRRAAERRRLQRQLERRRERDIRRRRVTLVASIIGALAVIGVVVGFLIATGDDDKKPAAAKKPTTSSSASPSASSPAAPSTSASAAPITTTGACKYQSVTGQAALKNVGVPPDPAKLVTTDEQVVFTTNRGVIKATLDGKLAPCNTQALTYLIKKKFYDNTPCPRVVDSGIYVVQCGSGGSSTAGGPTFTSPDENTAKADYAAGAIAIANTGAAHTGSSQFFFITQDSNSGLQKSYTLVGHVTQGLTILQAVAKGGNDGSSAAGGGTPKLSLVFEKVTVRPIAG
ncbi:peptidylprolyl isomerase [uncultured Jatrophihabitans sp.]|uniref:peptidylprolyl isomerase n=1 Tax=uncultured Jatrophihabitans sp. TaxID=1610747 RepID=UPI0035CA2124